MFLFLQDLLVKTTTGLVSFLQRWWAGVTLMPEQKKLCHENSIVSKLGDFAQNEHFLKLLSKHTAHIEQTDRSERIATPGELEHVTQKVKL